MPDKSWKAMERRMAKDMGCCRIPVTGERLGADARTSLFCLQFKLRRSLPAWLFTWLRGIRGTAEKEAKIGVLVLKIPRMRDTDALVVLTWKDWVALHGDTADPPPAGE